MSRIYRLLLVSVLCGFVLTVAFAQPASRPSQGLFEDAASYAADNGVSLDEAVRRLRLQAEIGHLDEALKKEESSFSGLWIEHQPRYRVVVRFQDPSAEGRLRARVADTSLEELIETRPAAVSLAKLEERRAAALQRVRQVRFAVDSDINIFENRVEIYSDRPQALRSALAVARATLPERVEIVAVPALAEPAVLRGGDGDPGYCTGGFTVQDTYTGELGITTAAHCGNTQSFQGFSLPFRFEVQADSRDVQWHSACTFLDVSNEFNSGLGYRACTGMHYRSQQAIGSYVCKWGNATGRTCGYIQSKSVSVSYVFNSYSTFVRVDGRSTDLSSPGDSGGPWFVDGTAYGIHSGSPGSDPNDAIYMPIEFISTLAISLLTADPGPSCPPVALFSWRASGTVIYLDATPSSDSDGSIVSYAWEFEDGSTGSGLTFTYDFGYEGGGYVGLRVTDTAGKTGVVYQWVYTANDPCRGDMCCTLYCG